MKVQSLAVEFVFEFIKVCRYAYQGMLGTCRNMDTKSGLRALSLPQAAFPRCLSLVASCDKEPEPRYRNLPTFFLHFLTSKIRPLELHRGGEDGSAIVHTLATGGSIDANSPCSYPTFETATCRWGDVPMHNKDRSLGFGRPCFHSSLVCMGKHSATTPNIAQ